MRLLALKVRVGPAAQSAHGCGERPAPGRVAGVPPALRRDPHVRTVWLHRGQPLLHEPRGQDRRCGTVQLFLQGEFPPAAGQMVLAARSALLQLWLGDDKKTAVSTNGTGDIWVCALYCLGEAKLFILLKFSYR